MYAFKVQVTGEGTSGAFELHYSDIDGGPVYSTGTIPVAAAPVDVRNRFLLLRDRPIVVSCPTPDKLIGPKEWEVVLNGMVWAPIHSANACLAGPASPHVNVVYLGYVEPERWQ